MAIKGTDKPVLWLLWNERPQVERVTGLTSTKSSGIKRDCREGGASRPTQCRNPHHQFEWASEGPGALEAFG